MATPEPEGKNGRTIMRKFCTILAAVTVALAFAIGGSVDAGNGKGKNKNAAIAISVNDATDCDEFFGADGGQIVPTGTVDVGTAASQCYAYLIELSGIPEGGVVCDVVTSNFDLAAETEAAVDETPAVGGADICEDETCDGVFVLPLSESGGTCDLFHAQPDSADKKDGKNLPAKQPEFIHVRAVGDSTPAEIDG